MWKRLLLMVLVASPAFAAEAPLTNEDVMAMTRAGLSAETIVAKIQSSDTAFTTDANALVSLAGAGVADAVIRVMVGTKPTTRPRVKAAPPAIRKRIDEVSVATDGGGRCDHATLQLSATGVRTTGCHETDVAAQWKDVQSVCYVTSFRSSLVIGGRRIYLTTPAELDAVRKSIRGLAPRVPETTDCR